MLYIIFLVLNDVVTVFQFSLESFERNGLAVVAGENLAVLIHRVSAVNVRLAEVHWFPTKTPIHILEGFTLC